MAKNITLVDIYTDTFMSWLNRTNEVINAISTEVVTLDQTAAGAVTSGNGSVNGYFSVSVLSISTGLRGGTNDVPADLPVSSNLVFSSGFALLAGLASVSEDRVAVGNSTSNVVLTPGAITGGANAELNRITGVTFEIASTLLANATHIRVGNSTVNTVITSNSITTPELITPILTGLTQLGLGNSTVNTQITATGVVAPSIQARTNVWVGNNTVNTTANATTLSTSFVISNNANVANIHSASVRLGNTQLTENTLNFANVIITKDEIRIGNSTVNVVINSSMIVVPTIASSNSLDIPFLDLGNTTVNTYVNGSHIRLGGLMTANQTNWNAGNSTVFSYQVQTGLGVANTVGNTVINANGLTVQNSTVNFTFTKPTAAQKATGDYWLNANNTWSQVPAAANNGDSSGQFDTTGTSAQLFHSYLLTGLRTVEYTVSIKNNTANGYQAQKILCLNTDGDIDMTEFAIMFSNGIQGVFTANSNTTHGRLWITPTASNTTIKYFRVDIEA